MSVTLDLPDDAQSRLEAEAARRGITVDQVVAHLAAQLPDSGVGQASAALEEFFGSGDSGDSGWATRDIHELRHDLAQRRLGESA